MILTIRRANSSNIRRSAYRGSNKKGVSKPPDHRKQTVRMLGQSGTLYDVYGCKTHLEYSIAVSVVVLFFISWSPFHFQRMTYVYFKTSDWFRTVNQYLFYFSGNENKREKFKYTLNMMLSGFLYYLSSTLNPLLYTILSVKYRESFKKVILCRSTRYNCNKFVFCKVKVYSLFIVLCKINESPYSMLTNAREPPSFMSSLVKIVRIFAHPIKLFTIVRPQNCVI